MNWLPHSINAAELLSPKGEYELFSPLASPRVYISPDLVTLAWKIGGTPFIFVLKNREIVVVLKARRILQGGRMRCISGLFWSTIIRGV